MFHPSLPKKRTNALVENPIRHKKISGVLGRVFGIEE